jgi:hypothetical protein
LPWTSSDNKSDCLTLPRFRHSHGNQAHKRAILEIPSCTPAHSSAINNSPRAVVWLAGRIVCISRARPASKFHRERVKNALNRPGHGTSFGKATRFPKGTFKARTSKGSFLNFLSSVLGCAKCVRRNWRFTRTEGHTVARVRAPDPASP